MNAATRWILLATATILVALPPATSAAPGPEQTILDGFLRQYDRQPGLPYCARVAGAQAPADGPALPVDHVNGTNRFMDEHMNWHTSQARARLGADHYDDNNTYGLEFIMMHRMSLAVYDAWRVTHGFEVLQAWDPATPIPPRFSYAVPDACAPRDSDDPAVPLPTWFTVEGGAEQDPVYGYHALCEFPTLNRFAKSVDFGADDGFDLARALANATDTGPSDNYHSRVHDGVGGDMEGPSTSMRDPVFWAWHKFLDDRFRVYEQACGDDGMDGMSMLQGPGPHANASAPARGTAPGLSAVIAVVACLASARSLRRHFGLGEPGPTPERADPRHSQPSSNPKEADTR